MTNLVAARIGRPPVMRRSILTVFNDRAPEVGVPGENPNLNQPGLVLSGFVDRVGDPVPLVAADGSSHSGERVLVEALDAMARTVGGGAPIAIAVPAHWGPATVGALRGALRAKPSLAPDGVPAALIPDSVAALCRRCRPPRVFRRMASWCCAISAAAAPASRWPMPDRTSTPSARPSAIPTSPATRSTRRCSTMSWQESPKPATPIPRALRRVGSLARLRDECRQAKERLSAETATVVPADLPGFTSDVRVTRTELENLISGPLAGLLTATEETLQRNNVPVANVSAVATVGGGANIPLVTQQLSERLRAPVVTTPQSAAQRGGRCRAGRRRRRWRRARPPGWRLAADAPTSIAAAGWAAGAAGLAATRVGSDGAASATFRALAWSQDDSPGAEPVPYSGEDYSFDPGPTDARPQVAFAHEE